ncbi:hypothetical protein K1X84_13325 [bacterium]|nr:hypothetical protein [bacterium]
MLSLRASIHFWKLKWTLLLLFWVAACSDSKNESVVSKASSDNLTRQEAHLYLEELSKKTASSNEVNGLQKRTFEKITQASFLIKIAKKGNLPMAEILDEVPPFIMVDGEKYEVRMEVFNNKQAEAFAQKSSIEEGDVYGIYADPADYYDGQSDHVDFPVQIVSMQNGVYETREEIWTAPYAADIDQIDDEFNQYIANLKANTPYPLFAVTREFVGEDPQDSPSLSKSAAVGPYLGFEGVYLKVERDGLSNEEFELWWTDPNLGGLIHQRDLFNGNHHNDASGANVKFPDVNHEGNWEQLGDEFSVPIRLISLSDGFVHFLTPWEDDDGSGSMQRFHRQFPDEYVSTINVIAQIKIYADAFNCETNHRDDDIPGHYALDGYAEVDEDDPYSEGAVYRITSASIYQRSSGGAIRFETNQATNGGLDDINYRFRYFAQ